MLRSRISFLALAALASTTVIASSANAQIVKLGWIQLTPAQSPPARAAMASAYDPISHRTVIFGGFGPTNYFNDTWTFDGTTWTKMNTPVAPSGRAAASMAYDEVTHTIVLFGGFNTTQHYLGDTWIWNGATSTWTQATTTVSPTPVTGPMTFTDPISGHVDVYGGYDGHFYQLTTYRWTGSDWVQLQPAHSPWARSAAVCTLDRAHHKVVLFGGLASVNPWNTWTWDGVDWTMESPAHQPQNRYDSAGVFDPHFHAVIVFGGGAGGAQIDDTWQWNGTDWAELQPMFSPSPRESFAAVYDATLGHLVLFGGQGPNALDSDTWWLARR